MTISEGHVVSISYTLKDDAGNVLDSSAGKDPLSFLKGGGNVIQGMETAVEGKEKGDSFSVTISPAEGYGEYEENMIFTMPKDKIDGIDTFEIGMQIQAQTNDGVQILTVKEVAEDTVTFDGNHPLAGKDLHFAITIEDVREATAEEQTHGHAH